jgi:hypothetical protein
MCDPHDVQAVKDALAQNANNIGVGVIHEPTGRVFLKPFDDVPGGHAQIAGDAGIPLSEARGFLVGRSGSGYQVVNLSHLNSPAPGSPGPMQMPQPLFDLVLQSLRNAGL